MSKLKIITIIFIVFLLALMWLIVFGYSYRLQYSTVFFTYDMHDDMYDLMNHIHNLFTNNNIEYSIAAGTTLGQARNKSIIPWDDDMDSYIRSADSDSVENLLKNDPLLIYNKAKFGYQTSFKQESKKGYLDIFVLYDEGDKLIYRGHPDRTNEWLYKTEWEFDLVDFGPYKVYTIKNNKKYLDRAYGSEWEKIGKTAPRHGQSKSVGSLLIDTNWSKYYTNYFRGKKLYE